MRVDTDHASVFCLQSYVLRVALRCPLYQATMHGTKRRELAELRENIQVAVDDVARTSVGASPQEVCCSHTQCALKPAVAFGACCACNHRCIVRSQVSAKYQHQLVHVYILIEQVDPNPQVKADLTEIFTVRDMQTAYTCCLMSLLVASRAVCCRSVGPGGARSGQSATSIFECEGCVVHQFSARHF